MTIPDTHAVLVAHRGIVVTTVTLAVLLALGVGWIGITATSALARNGDLLDQLDSARWAGTRCELDRLDEITGRAANAAELLRGGPIAPSRQCWIVKRTKDAEVLACEVGP